MWAPPDAHPQADKQRFFSKLEDRWRESHESAPLDYSVLNRCAAGPARLPARAGCTQTHWHTAAGLYWTGMVVPLPHRLLDSIDSTAGDPGLAQLLEAADPGAQAEEADRCPTPAPVSCGLWLGPALQYVHEAAACHGSFPETHLWCRSPAPKVQASTEGGSAEGENKGAAEGEWMLLASGATEAGREGEREGAGAAGGEGGLSDG